MTDNTLTVEALADEIHRIDDINRDFATMIAAGLLPFINRHIAGRVAEQPRRSISVDAEVVSAIQSIEADENQHRKEEKERLLFVLGEYDFSMPVQAFNVIAGMMVDAKPPKPAGACRAVDDGAHSWSDPAVHGKVECLFCGDVQPKPAVAVPLPETPIYMLAVDGSHIHFTDGSGSTAEQMIESVTRYRPGAKCDVQRLYTEQMLASYGDAREAAGRADTALTEAVQNLVIFTRESMKASEDAVESRLAEPAGSEAVPEHEVQNLAFSIGVYYHDGKVDLCAPLYAFTPSELTTFARRLTGSKSDA